MNMNISIHLLILCLTLNDTGKTKQKNTSIATCYWLSSVVV